MGDRERGMGERERDRDRMITEEASTGRHVAWTTQRTSTLAELFVKPRSHTRNASFINIGRELHRFISELTLLQV